MRIMLTGGGTGGHVYPAVQVLKVLKDRYGDSLSYSWIGDRRGPEFKIAQRESIPFHSCRSGKLRRYFSIQNVFDIFNVLIGFIQAFFILRSQRPDILFSKGGFVSVPPVLAAALLHIPVITHESDIYPGLANRINTRFAEVVCVAYEESKSHYPKGVQVVVTGNPIRRELLTGNAEHARELFDLPDDLPIILVLGGSQGALEINRIIWQWAESGIDGMFIIHQAGEKTYRDCTYANYMTTRFIGEELGDVLQAADVVISRAGAGAIGEIAASDTPMVLIPKGMGSTRGDQIHNAEFFQHHGAAIVVKDEEVSLDNVKDAVLSILSDREKSKMMTVAAKGLIRMDAAERIADELTRSLHEKGGV